MEESKAVTETMAEKFKRIFTSWGLAALVLIMFLTTLAASFNGAFESPKEGFLDFVYKLVAVLVYGFVQLIPGINESIFIKRRTNEMD